MIAQWDDHEVVNDFGAQWSRYRTGIGEPSGYANLVEAGRRGFMNYAAIDTDRLDTDRIHRAFRWGAALDVFVIDARSHRSRNDLPDRAETGKTLLGAEQLDWLSAGLESSKAVWKVVSSDVPMSIPTGTHAEVAGNDGWAGDETGFERELRRLLARLDAADVTNLVFVTTDVHRAAVIGYSFDADGDGDPLVWHEIVTGPLNAGAAPRLVQSDLDPTFHPKLLYSEGSFFNFGQVTVARLRDGRMGLRAAVRDTAGEVRPGSLLKLEPQ